MKANQKSPVVLMYHGIISDLEGPPTKREIGAELYDVSLENFRAQLHWLKENGFVVVTLFDKEEELSANKVIITFDDGEMNNCLNAFPELKSLGFCAYFFIIAKRVGKEGYMGWDELKKMHEAGMRIGSHGFSHEILTNLKNTQIEEELSASKKFLQRNLGAPIDSLSVPRGFCSDKIIQMAYEAGYKQIFISDRPGDLTKKCYSRVAIKREWTIQRFQQAMGGVVPRWERMTNLAKRSITLVIRESGYNELRKLIIKLFK